jgi:hypothetical protein
MRAHCIIVDAPASMMRLASASDENTCSLRHSRRNAQRTLAAKLIGRDQPRMRSKIQLLGDSPTYDLVQQDGFELRQNSARASADFS